MRKRNSELPVLRDRLEPKDMFSNNGVEKLNKSTPKPTIKIGNLNEEKLERGLI